MIIKALDELEPCLGRKRHLTPQEILQRLIDVGLFRVEDLAGVGLNVRLLVMTLLTADDRPSWKCPR
jgi:hypothetical protein